MWIVICNMWFAMHVLCRVTYFWGYKIWGLSKIYFKQNILWKKLEDGQVVSNHSTVLMIDTLRFYKHPWNPWNILFSKINFPTGYGCLHFILISSWTRLELFPSYQQCISRESLLTQICVIILAVVDVCVKDQGKQWEQYHLHS